MRSLASNYDLTLPIIISNTNTVYVSNIAKIRLPVQIQLRYKQTKIPLSENRRFHNTIGLKSLD